MEATTIWPPQIRPAGHLLSMGSTAPPQSWLGCAPGAPCGKERLTCGQSPTGSTSRAPSRSRCASTAKTTNLRIDPRATLLDCIRETVALTGTKKGCDHGQCGACTVHVNGRRVNYALASLDARTGKKSQPSEGLGTPDTLHPCKGVLAHDGYQCGYCTLGPDSCRPLHYSRNLRSTDRPPSRN